MRNNISRPPDTPVDAMVQLVQLNVFGPNLDRDIIVAATIPLFQLHRALQFCIKPRQSDDTIAALPFTISHTGTGTVLTGTKTKKLCDANPASPGLLEVADVWVYEVGGQALIITLMDFAEGDARHYVPRCIAATGGKDDLDAINSKLIRRYFTVAGAKKGDTKRLPGLLCGPGTSNASLFASHMNHMRAPLDAMM